VTWVVGADLLQAHSEFGPPADAFFESRLTLKPLQPSEARELLLRRLPKGQPLDGPILEAIVEGSDGLPRSLVQGLRSVIVEGRSPEMASAERDERQRRLSLLGESALRIAEELEASGGSSASDEVFLARVGLSRASVTRLLRQMEAQGLVRAAQEVRETSGRPRRVYRLTDPIQAET
jgi:DNA-binding transcriptional ArsR family regulator